MKFYPFEVNTGAVNMQIDRELLENAISKQSKEPIFRLDLPKILIPKTIKRPAATQSENLSYFTDNTTSS